MKFDSGELIRSVERSNKLRSLRHLIRKMHARRFRIPPWTIFQRVMKPSTDCFCKCIVPMVDLRSLKNLHQSCSSLHLLSNAREWKEIFETGSKNLLRKGYGVRLAHLIAIHPEWVPHALLALNDGRYFMLFEVF